MILSKEELNLIYLCVNAFHDEMKSLKPFQTDPLLIKKFDDKLSELRCLSDRILFELNDD